LKGREGQQHRPRDHSDAARRAATAPVRSGFLA
jgi:hypothetical protein